MLDEKDLQAIDQLMAHRMNIILESEISPKLNLLAEGMEILQEKMAPRSRVDELDEEIKFLKLMVRQMNERINNLEKASHNHRLSRWLEEALEGHNTSNP